MTSGTVSAPAGEVSRGLDATALAGATIRRVSTRLVPFLFVLYVINYLDRTNVALAALQMNHDLRFSNSAYAFGVGVFFLGYAPFEAPSNLLLTRFGARRWIARIMITWGALAAAMMFMRTPLEFYILRFSVGVAEAGFYPGVVYYLSLWFPRADLGRALAGFMLASPLSGVIGGPVGGWLLGLSGRLGLRGWQWLFLLEGIPAILLGIVALFYLTDSVADAHWLSEDQRLWLSERIRAEREEVATSPSTDSAWHAFRNPLVWLLGVVYLFMLTAGYARVFWTPLVVRDATHASSAVVGWLTGGISAAGALAVLLGGASSDLRNERFVHAACGAALSAIGFVLVASVPPPYGPVLGLALAYAGLGVFQPSFWCIPSLMLRGAAASLGIGIVASVGNLGGFLGPYSVGLLKDATGTATAAYLGMAAISLAAAVLVLLIGRHEVFVASRHAAPTLDATPA